MKNKKLWGVKMNENVGTADMTLDKKEDIVETVKGVNSIPYRIVKRIFDLLVSSVGLVFLIPIILIVKIIYICTGDFHSIFLVQKRIGKGGKEFNFFKFRTMVPDADKVLEKLLKENKELAEEYKENKKLKNDPRITKAGRFIRRYSIDELPQILNVLCET